MTTDVDVLVVGAGPGGIVAADSLSEAGARVLLVDAGRPYQRRTCPVDMGRACHGCRGVCNVISGFGGSIHFGDGVKLSRFPSGRRLAELLEVGRVEQLTDEVIKLLCGDDVPAFCGAAASSPVPVKDYPVASLSAEQVRTLIGRVHGRLAARSTLELRMLTDVRSIRPDDGGRWTVELSQVHAAAEVVRAGAVVVAVGRRGQRWWHGQIRDLGVKFSDPTPSVGVRFECPKELLQRGAEIHGDFKTTMVRHGVKVKTFCFCAGPGGGRIKFTDYGTHTLLDGHVIPEDEEGGTANFALLAQLKDASGLPRDTSWVEAHLLAPYRALRDDRPGKPVLQWFPDFRDGRLSCSDLDEFAARAGFTPSLKDYRIANLAGILPPEVHAALTDSFVELMAIFTESDATDQVGVVGLELESLWDELELTAGMQTTLPGLYAVGDCSGLAQGILQAAVGGLAAATDILGVATRTSGASIWVG